MLTKTIVDRYHELLPRAGNRGAMVDVFSKAGLELKIYPSADHVPMEELPDETSADAHAFLSR